MEMDTNRLPEGPLPRWLAARYMKLVRCVAYRLARRLPSHVNIDDLIGAGYVGLADALNKYDRSGPDRFEAYAECRIRGAMLDELRSYDPLSRDLRELNNRMVMAVRDLTAALGRPPDEIEIAKRLELSLATFRERLAKLSFGGLVSLDARGPDGGDAMQLGDDGERADVFVMRAERREWLSDALGQLPERLQSLLNLYYEQDYTLREIGELLGITESRVCQLHAEAILRLRALCRQDGELRENADESNEVTSVTRLRSAAPARAPRQLRHAG